MPRLKFLSPFLLGGILALPAMAAASTPNAHLQCTPGTSRCLDCHTCLPLDGKAGNFHTSIESICRTCHRSSHATGQNRLAHPSTGKPAKDLPRDLPLDREGNITCITCHFFHIDNMPQRQHEPHLLRRPANRLFCGCCHIDK
ncbi:MAG: hypothetical protein AB1568_08740 [Thermodesulfobacteriota bacterium]